MSAMPDVASARGVRADEKRLLKLAREGDEHAFSELAGTYRAELRAHCSRIVGSVADAEDALQEGLLRAWRGLPGFEGRGSVRSWMYAVVTNAAHDLARSRWRRELPVAFGSSTNSGTDLGPPLMDRPWLDPLNPYPGHCVSDHTRLSPESRYEQRETVELAFMIALQQLPPLQRTVLLLRDVVGLSTPEIASRLATTSAAVNSALQRARGGLRNRLPADNQQSGVRTLGNQRDRAIVQRYAHAIERGDTDTLISLLTHDVSACQLPAQDAQFAGRETELARLDRILDEAGNSGPLVISITGTAGVGKTALAVHWANQVASRFGDGQLYLNLHGYGPYGEPVSAATAIRSLLGALQASPGRIPADADGQADLYRSALARRRILIVLDNARDADHVRELLPDSGGCLVVVTSRGPLPGLVTASLAQPIWLDVLTEADARSLLVQRLGAPRLGTGAVVDELIELCARLPLALSVVAAQAAEHPGLTLRSIVAQLRDERRRLDVLDAEEPVTGVRSVLSRSYRQLSDAAGRVFRLLGLHPGPDLSVPAAASLAGVSEASVWSALGELTRSGLLTEHAPGRFICHDLLRSYAAELTRAQDREADRRAAMRRVLDYYLQASVAMSRSIDASREQIGIVPAAEHVVTVGTVAPEEAVAWFGAEHQVLMAAVVVAAHEGFDPHAWQLAWAIQDHLRHSGQWQAMVAAHRFALQAAVRLGDPTAQAHALRGLGVACTMVGALDEGISYMSRALELFSQLDDAAALARAHLNMATVVSVPGHYGDAIRHAERARGLFRTTDHKSGQAAALNNIAWYHIQLGNHRRALACAQQALATFRLTDDRVGQALALESLAIAHHHLGNYASVLEHGGEALLLARQFRVNDLGLWHRDRSLEAEILEHLSDAHHELGDDLAACTSLTEALCTLGDLKSAHAEELRHKLRALGQHRDAVGASS